MRGTAPIRDGPDREIDMAAAVETAWSEGGGAAGLTLESLEEETEEIEDQGVMIE